MRWFSKINYICENFFQMLKNIYWILLCVIMSLTSSCNIEKRLHNNGYFFISHDKESKTEIYHSKHVEKNNTTLISGLSYENLFDEPVNETVVTQDKTTKSTSHGFHPEINNSIVYNFDEKNNYINCDTIVLRNESFISAKIFETGTHFIKFRYCGGDKNKYTSIKISEVKSIRFANGDIWVPPQPENIQKRKLELFSFFAFLFSITGLFFAGLIFGSLAVIIGYRGLMRFKKHPDKFKGKEFSILAIVLGIICILGVLLILSGIIVL
jgi:hypothetical protein